MASQLLAQLQQNLQQNPCPVAAERVPAAVLMALTDEATPQLLLIRRALHLSAHPGEIALPGGKAEAGDADLRETALREAWEEVGLAPEAFRYGGHLPPRTSMAGLAVTAFVGVIPPGLPLRLQADEVAELLYAPLHHFADGSRLRADRVTRGGDTRIAARYQYRHYTIWGMTAGFIVDLVNGLYGAGLDVARRQQSLSGATT